MASSLRNTWTLARVRLRLALRSRVALFFSFILPLSVLFVYAAVFGPRDPRAVGYVLAAVLALTVMGSFWGMSAQLVSFRERGILRRFRLAPVGAGAMLGSSIISNFFLILPTIILEFLIARWVFGMKSWGNLWGVLALVTLGTATFSALGLIVASVTNSLQETQVINNVIWMCFLFLSGATIPLPAMPDWVQRAAVFLPATYLVTGLQQALLRGTALHDVAADILALAGTFVVAFFLSRQLFRWEPEEKVAGRAKLWAAAAIVPFLILGAWENARGERRKEAKTIYDSIQRRAGLRAIER
jgi:ABC-type transport system involved in cytochrome c biogenesis permease component